MVLFDGARDVDTLAPVGGTGALSRLHGVEIRGVWSEKEREAVFRGRHRVYVEELGVMPPRPSGMVTDRFDRLDGTLNLAAVLDGRIVGGARFVVDRGHGTPVDDRFDFAAHLPVDAVGAGGSMLWVLPEARGRRDLVPRMMKAGHLWCADQGATHVLGTVNPRRAAGFRRAGYHPVGQAFTHEGSGLPMLPVVLTLRRARAVA